MKTNKRYFTFQCGCEYEENKALSVEYRDNHGNLRPRFVCPKHKKPIRYVVYKCLCCGSRIERYKNGKRITKLGCPPMYCDACTKAMTQSRYYESKNNPDYDNQYKMENIPQERIDEAFAVQVQGFKPKKKKGDTERIQPRHQDVDIYATKYAYSEKKESEYFSLRRSDCKHYEKCIDIAIANNTNATCPKNCTHYEYKPLDINDFVVVKNIMRPTEKFETVDKEFKRLLKKLTILEKKHTGKSIGWKDKNKQWHKAYKSRQDLITGEKPAGGKSHAANS